jgi:hypothetical protein
MVFNLIIDARYDSVVSQYPCTFSNSEDQQLVKKILKHLHLFDVKRKPPPCANSPPAGATIINDAYLRPSADDYLIDADYPIEKYM